MASQITFSFLFSFLIHQLEMSYDSMSLFQIFCGHIILQISYFRNTSSQARIQTGRGMSSAHPNNIFQKTGPLKLLTPVATMAPRVRMHEGRMDDK